MTEEEWRPDLVGEMRSGKSAWEWTGYSLWAVWPGLLLLAIVMIGMLITGKGYGEVQFLTVVMGMFLATVAYAVVTGFIAQMRRSEEKRAGYTTTTNEFPHLPQIDPRTKRIVRLAGEPLLSREQYQDRIRLINEAIAESEGRDSAR